MRIPLIKITQWLSTWEKSQWSPQEGLSKPPDHFFVGSIRIDLLRKIAGVRTRDLAMRKRREALSGYQRILDTDRAQKIHRYMLYGYPISSQPSLDPSKHTDLLKPGWLPTAVLINVMAPGEQRPKGSGYLKLPEERALKIEDVQGAFSLNIPDQAMQLIDGALEPIEIIDGQHRLYALESDESLRGTYELPVVVFNNLSPEWQAYLFWVINVEPKKINTSLAFDLYPELRNQKWLERGEAIKIYQEHRAQEIVETLWRHEASPWRDRIELHGRRIDGHVSNAAMIRSLMSSYVRQWGPDDKIGGLFGSVDKDGHSYVIRWTRNQQAAFVIFLWRKLHENIKKANTEWINDCRNQFATQDLDTQNKINPFRLDPAFAGAVSLLATDQGVRAILVVTNALLQFNYDALGLASWERPATTSEIDDELVSELVDSLSSQANLAGFLDSVFGVLVNHLDWRTSAAPGLSDEAQKHQAAYRGSSGYRMLQKDCLSALIAHSEKEIRYLSEKVFKALRME